MDPLSSDHHLGEKSPPKKEPVGSVAFRVTVAVCLALCILLVVLLTCLLLKLPDNTSDTESTPDSKPPADWLPFPTTGDHIILDNKTYYINSSVNATTIVIQNNGRLVFWDTGPLGDPIKLRTKYIVIQNNGEMHIGSNKNRYLRPLDITLYGKADDPDTVPAFGRKFIGVTPTGTLEIHGPWKLSWTFLTMTITPGENQPIINLADDASTWKVGDQIVIASSDYDMNQAEVFTIVDCGTSCSPTQVKLSGTVKYLHLGEVSDEGVDMRAEVGLLTRNIKIHGEMESSCYDATNVCDYFDYDTFGGTTHVLKGSKAVHIEGVELYNMGQQVLGRYPIHFHRVYEVYGYYAKQLSIHNCFSRCVTVHATIGLKVEDVVGYDTIGHCFFLEDGNEQDNVFSHNLGLLTKPGSLLPADRNNAMCTGLQSPAGKLFKYTPNADKECCHVSTFWISHPNNTFVNNSAAGSQEVGYYFAFYRVATGPSAGTLPAFDGERSPLKMFDKNRAHANRRVGFLIDNGIKPTDPSADDPREFLALIDLERYQPHINKDLSQPRAPANITNFIGYMNSLGMFVRGGDVWILNASLSDNDVGVIMASSGNLPYDSGSHQELINSTIVSYRSNASAAWTNRPRPSVGVEICDGPILVERNVFQKFGSVGGRVSYAVGFCPNNSGQNSPLNTVGNNTFPASSQKLFMGEVGGYYGNYDKDGDLTQIVYDRDGALSGRPHSYVVRADNWLLNNSNCQLLTGVYNAAVCSNKEYGQLFVNATTKNSSLSITDLAENAMLTLRGSNADDHRNYPTTTQYQPVIIANHSYRLTWPTDSQPRKIDLSIYHLKRDSFVQLEIPFTNLASLKFVVTHRVWNQVSNTVVDSSFIETSSGWADYNSAVTSTYYQNDTVLYVKLINSWKPNDNVYNYCPADGCHFFNIAVRQTLPFPTNQLSVTLDNPVDYVLNHTINVSSIVIQNSATLTIVDTGVPIKLRTKCINIKDGSGLYIGSESQPYTSPLEIALYGRSDDTDYDTSMFGHKYIGVEAGGTLAIHGPWKLSWTYLTATLQPGDSKPIINLADDASTWKVGDQIVIASSDYDMNQAEVFTIVDCGTSCSPTQVKLNGTVTHRHLGTITEDGVDMRAEVGLLTRNIKIYGELNETGCYGNNMCEYFKYDTFGGHIMMLQHAKSVRLEGIELYHLGQQVLARYPVHWHIVGEVYGDYAKQLSIHNCFSRCVTIHGCIGAHVEDVVGYDTIGHCFFLEDGNEQDNVLIHNLGLVTKPGSLLPADRTADMCRGLQTESSKIYNYTPNAETECMHVSTFWISHPNNTFINNSAAGSQDVGYFIAFYREPTGPSAPVVPLPPFHGERTTLQIFEGNRAHSNRMTGFLIDSGIKTTFPSASDPRDQLSLIDLERYHPHIARNLSYPRDPAKVDKFTGYKNAQGMFVRGGDIFISNAKLSDNDVAVVMASSKSLPYDAGSHQELVNSTIVGRSLNDMSWFTRTGPCVGVEVRNGPILVDRNAFKKFESSDQRSAYAVGFYPNSTGQNSPLNTIGNNTFDSITKKFFMGQKGGYYGNFSNDGDLTQILYDRDGVLSSRPGSYIIHSDNSLLNTMCSLASAGSNAAVCTDNIYGQVFINATLRNAALQIDDTTNGAASLTLNGFNANDPVTYPNTTQYQPVLIANHTYRLSWKPSASIPNLHLSMHNFEQYSWVVLQFPYPLKFNVTGRIWIQSTGTSVEMQSTSIPRALTLEAMNNNQLLTSYFHDSSSGYLHFKLVYSWPFNSADPYDYCPADGCRFYNIVTG